MTTMSLAIATWGGIGVAILLWLLTEELRRAKRLRTANLALDAVISRLRTGPPPLVLLFVLAAVFLLIPDPAFAQGFGGGSFMQGFLSWIQSSVLTTLATLAIIGAGILLMVSHHSIVGIITICAGIWIIFNADTLVGMLH